MTEIVIREATVADLPDIDGIYNHYVATSTCTYQYEPTTPEERLAWFRARGPNHPVTVAVVEGEVVGWGSLSEFRARAGYRFTVENAVYVRHDRQRQGIGRRLLGDLVERAAQLGHRSIVAAISAEQHGSIRLHEQAGFVEVGRLREVAVKFDRWLDVVFMQRMLGPSTSAE